MVCPLCATRPRAGPRGPGRTDVSEFTDNGWPASARRCLQLPTPFKTVCGALLRRPGWFRFPSIPARRPAQGCCKGSALNSTARPGAQLTAGQQLRPILLVRWPPKANSTTNPRKECPNPKLIPQVQATRAPGWSGHAGYCSHRPNGLCAAGHEWMHRMLPSKSRNQAA
jgi:hypothetical protein